MRVLIICRLYSGFEQSLKTRMWTPTGTPTIARLIEKIDGSSDLEMKVVLTVKSQNPTWEPRDEEALESMD